MMKATAVAMLALALAAEAHAACNPAQVGNKADCPEFTAPAATAVPGPSIDGSTIIPSAAISITLFNGVVPPNGFMVQIAQVSSLGIICLVNDNGPASIEPMAGFLIGGIWVNTPLPNTFVTPPGYKPMGPVSISCTGGIPLIEARGW
jgi:hypothetical protein